MKTNYIKTKIQSLIIVSKIVVMHYYEFDENFFFRGERHNFWEMIYVDKGRVEIKSGDDIIELNQGEIAFHAPNEFHSVKAKDSSPNFFVFSFECDSSAMEYFKKYHARLDKKLKPYIASIIRESEKTYVIPKNDITLKQLVKRDDAEIGGEQMIKTLLEQLFILLIRGMTESENSAIFTSKESMENHLSASIKEYIFKRIDSVIRVNDICDAFGYSKTYLSKVFREQTGNTIAEYVTLSKINRAKDMIRLHNQNFAEISMSLSFDNPQYFTRVFKRVTGMTPTEFKNSLNIDEFH